MIPDYVTPFLWSYNTTDLDIQRDKERIITNVLNHGTSEAIHWLFSTYSEAEIRVCIASPLAGEWNKKSLNYWSLIFSLTPTYPTERFVH